MLRVKGKWLPKTSRKAPHLMYCASRVFFGSPVHSDEHGHLKIYLPKKLLECLPKCSSLPKERHRWNTNEEIAAYLITFEKHEEWLTTSPKTSMHNSSHSMYNSSHTVAPPQRKPWVDDEIHYSGSHSDIY
ncbi:unnamed protein product [Lota lota]